MSEDLKRQKLGRGLSALLGEDRAPFGRAERPRGPMQVPVGNLRPSRFQPRQRFDEAALRELTDSIREKGILQPILVRPIAELAEHYEIIAGERRWRAAQMARLHEVPVIIKDYGDTESLELALIENIQRADLNAMEEARGYARLIEQFDHSQEEVGRLVGKSRSNVANMLRLLALPEAIQHMLEDGRLSAGHGRTLVTAPDPEALAQQIVTGRLSVRDAEALSKGRKPKGVKKPFVQKDPNIQAYEDLIGAILGLKITIEDRGEKGGVISIAYKTLEQLEDVSQRLMRPISK